MQRSVIKEVEQEYGLPFWDVVQGFAEDGYSATATLQTTACAPVSLAGAQASLFDNKEQQP